MNLMNQMPVGFLGDETRGGYLVTKEQKKVWACELDMLTQVMQICRKHNIRYFMFAGSLLGTMRHKGFIPWDDDIDLGMLREDYDRFVKIAPQELSAPFFLQTLDTEPECITHFAKLRNSDTSAVFDTWATTWHTHMNQGIFIDIFPIDGVPGNSVLIPMMRKVRKAIAHIRHHAVYWKLGGLSKSAYNLMCRMVVAVLGYHRVCRMIDWTYRIFPVKKSPQCGLVCWRREVLERFTWRSDMFDDLIEVPFEHLRVPVPRAYDECLRKSYGNWQVPVKGGSMHEGTVFYVDKSYKDVLVEQFGYRRDEFDTVQK